MRVLSGAISHDKRSTSSVTKSRFIFDWDAANSKQNLENHHVSFDEAVSVFTDARAFTVADIERSDKMESSRTIGQSSEQQILLVVHTERREGVRIIGARKATEYEKTIYRRN